MSAPSPYAIERAMSAAQEFAAAMRAADPEMDADDLLLAIDSETDALDLLRRVVRASLDADAMADAAGARMAALAGRKARFLDRKEATRGLAQRIMDALGMTKMEDAEFTVSIGKPRQKVIVTDPAALAEAFVRVTRSPDMTTINAAVKAGQVPAGCEVSNGAASLTIRTR
jgi:hypothetical protein